MEREELKEDTRGEEEKAGNEGGHNMTREPESGQMGEIKQRRMHTPAK